MAKSVILIRGEKSDLENNQVESLPVISDKKLSSAAKVVGDFSLIPTSAVDHIGLIGSVGLQKIRIPSNTKPTRKGWRLAAKR